VRKSTDWWGRRGSGRERAAAPSEPKQRAGPGIGGAGPADRWGSNKRK
jgi:hypothetical protein